MSYASDKIGNEIVGMSSYSSKTQCPCEACKKKRAAEPPVGYIPADPVTGHHRIPEQPAQPPTGDAQMVEQMLKLDPCTGCRHTRIAHCNLHDDKWACSECLCKNYMPPMPDGYVSLADVRTAFREHFETHNDYTLGDIVHCWGQIESILAKPAEQTNEQKVEAILRTPWIDNPMSYHKLAAEIVAALKAGKP